MVLNEAQCKVVPFYTTKRNKLIGVKMYSAMTDIERKIKE